MLSSLGRRKKSFDALLKTLIALKTFCTAACVLGPLYDYI